MYYHNWKFVSIQSPDNDENATTHYVKDFWDDYHGYHTQRIPIA